MRETTYTPIEGVIQHITKKAVLINVGGDEVWVPMSVIFEDDLTELEVGELMEINIAEWFAEKEGL